MNVSKAIARIKTMQGRYVALQEDIRDRINRMTKPLDKHVKKRLAEEFPEATFYFLSGFQCGSLSNAWKPQVYLYRVNDLAYSPEGYWYDELDRKMSKNPPPVPTRRLRLFLKTLSEEIGVKISLVCQKPYWLIEKEYPAPAMEEIYYA